MDLTLSGKTALVAGSTQGIGKATAIELASMGARVILLARDEQKLVDTLSLLNSISEADHGYLCADFSKPQQLEARLQEKMPSIGTVHILINNTGGPPSGKAKDAETREFVQAFEMHLLCNHILMKHCIAGMQSAGYGRIINVISTSVKQPLPNLGVSNTIRGAVANWAKTLATELGPLGITVNNVLPGATLTGRLESIAAGKAAMRKTTAERELQAMAAEIPLQRIADPAEIAYGICFLASPAAAYINGINLPIDGGRTSSL